MDGLENRVIPRKSGLWAQELPRYGESGFPIGEFAQFGRIQGGLQHARQNRVPAAVPRNEIEIPALAAAFAAFEHAHQNIAAPLEFGFRNLRRPDYKEPLPKEFSNLIGGQRRFQGDWSKDSD